MESWVAVRTSEVSIQKGRWYCCIDAVTLTAYPRKTAKTGENTVRRSRDAYTWDVTPGITIVHNIALSLTETSDLQIMHVGGVSGPGLGSTCPLRSSKMARWLVERMLRTHEELLRFCWNLRKRQTLRTPAWLKSRELKLGNIRRCSCWSGNRVALSSMTYVFTSTCIEDIRTSKLMKRCCSCMM